MTDREKIIEIIKRNGTYNGRSLSFDYYVIQPDDLADALIAAGLKFDTVISHTATFDLAQQEQINRLERDNAALRERLERAIETPCKDGDIFYRFFWHPNEMVEDMACGFRKKENGEIFVCSAYSESWYNIKDCEFSLKAAKARLKRMQKELQGD